MKEYVIYIAFVIFSAYLAFSIFREFISWSHVIKLYGYIPVKVCLITAQSVFRSSNRFHLLSPLLINLPLATLILYSPREVLPDWVVVLPSLLYLLIIILQLAAPPSLLLLGNSRWQTVRLMARIERGIFPYRIVSFLDDISADHMSASWLNHRKFEINNLRLQGTDKWRQTVFFLMRKVPQIVLDTRIPSPAVVEESQIILSKNLSSKVLLIMAEDGTTPSLDSIAYDEKNLKLTFITPQSVVSELRNRGMKHTKSPNDLPGMVPIVARKISDKVQKTGVVIEIYGQAVASAHNDHGNSKFIQEANEIYSRLVAGPGTLSELDKDLDEIQLFIARWKEDQNYWIQSIITKARKMSQSIGDLQIEIDAAPEGLVDEKQAKFSSL